MFFGSLIFASFLFLTGNINVTHAADSYTKLLLHGDGANNSTTFTDSEATPKTVTGYGNAKISTAQNKFGGSSIYFDATPSYAKVPTSGDFAFGTSDFTIDYWIYPISRSASANVFLDFRDGSGGAYWADGLSTLGNYFIYVNGATLVSSSAIVPLNTWTHIAAARSGTSLRVFINGNLDATVTNSTNFLAPPANLWIGVSSMSSQTTAAFAANSYFDELRISKGIARWTSNFTPPANAYDTYTQLGLMERYLEQLHSPLLMGQAVWR